MLHWWPHIPCMPPHQASLRGHSWRSEGGQKNVHLSIKHKSSRQRHGRGGGQRCQVQKDCYELFKNSGYNKKTWPSASTVRDSEVDLLNIKDLHWQMPVPGSGWISCLYKDKNKLTVLIGNNQNEHMHFSITFIWEILPKICRHSDRDSQAIQTQKPQKHMPILLHC